MRVLTLRNAALALVAGIGLSGCAYGPYGGLGVGATYGNGYDPYYNSYGYGSPYGGYGSYGSRNRNRAGNAGCENRSTCVAQSA